MPRPAAHAWYRLGTAVVVADVPTDAGLIRVTVATTGGRWLIDNAAAAPTP
ncbi:hypothetical protein [Nucisporomicrobium flavum]|uniref:hypothetical protein n=1 Tax=Nucisporomicrobium flavum TaxID=2785915 RepID=UPI0018F6F6DD|nr:hypothetical protein [Nucisporomicrobium flavum]